MARKRRHQRQTERGQALVETAAIGILLVALFLGVYGASELISADSLALTASRNAARIGAETGNNGYQPGVTPTDPTSIDKEIVAAVNAGFSHALGGASLTEVDIYQPKAGATAGYFNVNDNTMLIDRYTPNGAAISGPSGGGPYGLDRRSQIPGSEAQIGVRVVFQFSSLTLPKLFSGTRTQYTVYSLPPA